MFDEKNLADFYRALQISLQNKIHEAIEAVDEQAAKAEPTVGDLAFCMGSVFASVAFELIRDGAEMKVNEEQKEFLLGLGEPFSTGFVEKLELLSTLDPEKIEIVNQ